MTLDRTTAAKLLASMNLGSSVAEQDDLLETARVETSVFDDLLADRVDLVPGTKGSGKSALYRIFVDFLANVLLNHRKVVIAHGISSKSDTVFLAYKKEFEALSEDDFVDFWCIYLLSLAREQFIKEPRFSHLLASHQDEVKAFSAAYRQARIPDFEEQKSLKQILGWVLTVLKAWKPKIKYKPPDDVGEFELSLFETATESPSPAASSDEARMPQYIDALKSKLEDLLQAADLHIWLMVDRLDELFPRRSSVERRALRGLLRTLRLFESPRIRVKIFLRDDILEQVTVGKEGFTALTHVTARTANTLRWSEEQILTMIVRRMFASEPLCAAFAIDKELLKTSVEYQRQAFYYVFPETVYGGKRQSKTLRWIYTHTRDGRGVATPRDVIDLVVRAGQYQRDRYNSDPKGTVDRLLSGQAVQYGLDEVSKKKRTHLLQAEFPHHWTKIKKLIGEGTEYSDKAMKRIYGAGFESILEDFHAIGLVEKTTKQGKRTWRIPFVYRRGLELPQKFVAK